MSAGNGTDGVEPTQQDFTPAFDRLSTERRVLGSITDEDHAGLGPRNTAEVLTIFLQDDPYTDLTEGIQQYLDSLEGAGLIAQNGEAYELTDTGTYELTH